MWAKDPIFPRKTLYIPLDACKQPPSKEVEFVQKSGEDEIQVYFRQPKVGPTQPFGQNSGKTGFASAPGRTRSSSLRLEALAEMPRPLTPYRDSEPTSSMNSPFSSQRSSFSHARQTSASSHFNYLSNTTSEYGSSDDGLGQQSMSPAPDTRTNGMVPHSSNGDDSAGYGQSLSYASRNAQPPSSTLQKTLQIVRVPGTSVMKPASSGLNATRAQGRSPLISVDNLEEPTPSSSLHDSVVSVSSTSLGAPIPSNDRLSALSGTPANLRLRPRSPFDPATATASNHSSPGDSVLPTRPPPRSRKISKEAVPTTAQSGKSNQTLRLPGTLGKYITSASAGLVSSLMGDKNASNTGWLATSELETEMQMAREYQSRQQHRTSISSDRTLHNRSRSSVSLRSHQPENSAKSRRPPSLSGSRQPTSDDLFAI